MVQSRKWAKTFHLSVIVLVVTLATAPGALAQASEMGGAESEIQGAAPPGKG